MPPSKKANWSKGNNSFRYRKAARKLKGELEFVQFREKGPHQPQKLTGKRREGELYEERVGKQLEKLFPDCKILHGIWIRFRDEQGTSWCQPDQVVIDADRVLVVECKLTFTTKAWDQLELYCGLMAAAFPDKEVYRVVATKNLPEDKGGKLPSRIRDLERVFEDPSSRLIWFWRPPHGRRTKRGIS